MLGVLSSTDVLILGQSWLEGGARSNTEEIYVDRQVPM
jgi:hypothetical protein